MSKRDDQILADELARLGGSSLIGWVAKFLSTDIYEISFEIAVQPASIVSIVTSILDTEGELLGTEEISNIFEVEGLVGSGFHNMNPTLVNISIAALSDLQTHVKIQGKAKEGLIKQYAGKKAAQRVAHLLLDQLNTERLPG
jgi:hypothetical protein